MKRMLAALAVLVALLGPGCPRTTGPTPPVPPPPAPPERVVELGRVGNIGLLQLYVDGWDDLTREQRLLAWHLSLAAIAGDLIVYDQRYVRNLEVKTLLEGIASRGAAIDPDVRARLREFLAQFWLHHGLHDAATFEKLVPRFTFDELTMAALSTFAAGERFGFIDEADLRTALDDLRPVLFDPQHDRWLVAPEVPEGEDLLALSATNYYGADVKLEDLARFHDAHPLNAGIVRNEDDRLEEQIWRAGTERVPAGLYAPQLRRVVGHLRDALPYAGETQRAALELLITFLETGDPQAWTDTSAAWAVEDPAVDAVLGFVETDEDPRGLKGAWEGLVLVRDEARTARLRTLDAESDQFLARAPWPEGLQRPSPPTTTADGGGAAPPAPPAPSVPGAYAVLTATGDAAFLTPSALSLPNDPPVRQSTGVRDLQLVNVDAALRSVHLRPAVREFAFDDTEAAEALRCGDAAWETLTAVHDVVGHAPVPAAGTEDATTGVTLAEYSGTMAEARADLLALHFAEDPRLVDLGFLPDRACGEAAARDYVRGTLLLLRALPSDTVTRDGPRAHLLVVRYAIARNVVTVERKGGKTYLRIPDVTVWRDVVDELLRSIERIRAEGDYDGARALVETYGAAAPEGWRDEAVRRTELAGLPARFAFLPPSLEPVRDASGAIIDVRLVAPVDFDTLLMSWKSVSEEPLPPSPTPSPTPAPTETPPEPVEPTFDD
jgi:dipeptidyl-peptidase-3